MEKLLRQLVNEWSASQKAGFAARAKAAIDAYRPKKKEAKETKDPKRLNIRAGALSKLRTQCIATDIWSTAALDEMEAMEAKHRDDPVWKEWNAAVKLEDAIALQKKWKYAEGLKQDLVALKLYPIELDGLKLSKAERDENKKIQGESAKAKQQVAVNVDLQPIMNKVLPGLNDADFSSVVVALLLATGRRTTEILKTATFTYVSQYRVLFTGQLKTRGDPEPYEIDLLAPAEMVIRALLWVRTNVKTVDLSPTLVNTKFSKKVKAAVASKCDLNPHNLRGINAVACWQIWGKKVTMMGYLQSHLGHVSAESSARYQTFQVKAKQAWDGTAIKVEPEPETKEEKKEDKKDVGPFGLTWWSVPSKKNALNIAAMMKENRPLNVTAVKTIMGGTPALLNKLFTFEKNGEIIAEYNRNRLAKQ